MIKTKSKTKTSKLESFVNEMKTTTKGMTKVKDHDSTLLPCPCPVIMMIVTRYSGQTIFGAQVSYRAALPTVPSVTEVRKSTVFTFSLFFCLSLRLRFFYYPRRDHYSFKPLALCVMFCTTLSILVPSLLAPTTGWCHPVLYQ